MTGYIVLGAVLFAAWLLAACAIDAPRHDRDDWWWTS